MEVLLENANDYKIRSVIRFLNATHVKPAEIHRELVLVYRMSVMSEGKVRKWCRLLHFV